jgi:predicted acetyltransferase
MSAQRLRLRPVRPTDEAVVRAADAAMAPDDFIFALGLAERPFRDWLQQLADEEAGRVPQGRVPCSFLLAEVDGEVVGRVSIRRELNDYLLAQGGHIGYGVLPPFRRRGYAGEILRQALIIARARGVERALVTCDDDNAASIATIEGAGGRPDPQWPLDVGDSVPKRRYWID